MFRSLFVILMFISVLFWSEITFAQNWQQTFGGFGDDRGNSVQQTSDGGYIIAGATESAGFGGFDIHLVRTDADGKQRSLNGFQREWADRAHACG